MNDGGRYNTLLDGRRWLSVRNGTSETIPAFAVMRITGLESKSGMTVFVVGKPDATTELQAEIGDLSRIIINGPQQIVASKFGEGTQEYPCQVAITTTAAQMGPTSGAWTITSGKYGFRNLSSGALVEGGAPVNTTIRWVSPQSIGTWRQAKPDANVTAGSTGTFSIYASETDTTANVTAHYKWADDGSTLVAATEGWVRYDQRAERWEWMGGACGP